MPAGGLEEDPGDISSPHGPRKSATVPQIGVEAFCLRSFLPNERRFIFDHLYASRCLDGYCWNADNGWV